MGPSYVIYASPPSLLNLECLAVHLKVPSTTLTHPQMVQSRSGKLHYGGGQAGVMRIFINQLSFSSLFGEPGQPIRYLPEVPSGRDSSTHILCTLVIPGRGRPTRSRLLPNPVSPLVFDPWLHGLPNLKRTPLNHMKSSPTLPS